MRQPLDTLFAALADPTRRSILIRLGRGEARVGELVAAFSISQPAVSRHLAVLERAGLLIRERRGGQRHCRLVPGSLAAARDWLKTADPAAEMGPLPALTLRLGTGKR